MRRKEKKRKKARKIAVQSAERPSDGCRVLSGSILVRVLPIGTVKERR